MMLDKEDSQSPCGEWRRTPRAVCVQKVEQTGCRRTLLSTPHPGTAFPLQDPSLAPSLALPLCLLGWGAPPSPRSVGGGWSEESRKRFPKGPARSQPSLSLLPPPLPGWNPLVQTISGTGPPLAGGRALLWIQSSHAPGPSSSSSSSSLFARPPPLPLCSLRCRPGKRRCPEEEEEGALQRCCFASGTGGRGSGGRSWSLPGLRGIRTRENKAERRGGGGGGGCGEPAPVGEEPL